MSIRGDNITIPSGKQIVGRYSRHAFDYVIPPGDSGAGDTVDIILRSEYLASSRQGARRPDDRMASLQGSEQLTRADPEKCEAVFRCSKERARDVNS